MTSLGFLSVTSLIARFNLRYSKSISRSVSVVVELNKWRVGVGDTTLKNGISTKVFSRGTKLSSNGRFCGCSCVFLRCLLLSSIVDSFVSVWEGLSTLSPSEKLRTRLQKFKRKINSYQIRYRHGICYLKEGTVGVHSTGGNKAIVSFMLLAVFKVFASVTVKFSRPCLTFFLLGERLNAFFFSRKKASPARPSFIERGTGWPLTLSFTIFDSFLFVFEFINFTWNGEHSMIPSTFFIATTSIAPDDP